jgi:hypothetical protein
VPPDAAGGSVPRGGAPPEPPGGLQPPGAGALTGKLGRRVGIDKAALRADAAEQKRERARQLRIRKADLDRERRHRLGAEAGQREALEKLIAKDIALQAALSRAVRAERDCGELRKRRCVRCGCELPRSIGDPTELVDGWWLPLFGRCRRCMAADVAAARELAVAGDVAGAELVLSVEGVLAEEFTAWAREVARGGDG